MSNNRDRSFVFEIQDDSIDIGYDEDGMPKTIAKEKPVEAGAKAEPAVERVETGPTQEELAAQKAKDDELATIRRERDEAIARAREIEADAKAKIEAEREVSGKFAKDLDTRTDQAMRAHWEKLQGHKQLFESGVSSLKAQSLSAEQEIQAALDAGDGARLAKAQKVLSRTEIELDRLESGQAALDTEIENFGAAVRQSKEARAEPEPKVETKAEAPKPQTPDEWIDTSARAFVGDDGAKWLKDHKEYVTDTKLHNKLINFARVYADDNGEAALKTDDFRKALDQKFFPNKAADEDADMADEDDVVEIEAKPTKPVASKPRVTAAAPVSRSGRYFSSNNTSATQAKLPPYLVNKAKELGYEPAEYAQYIVKGIKDGKMPKNYLDPDYPHGQ